MARLYITYSSRDRALALQLAAQLRAYGHQIAIDVDSLVPGIEWRRELMDKLLLCDGVVVSSGLALSTAAKQIIMGTARSRIVRASIQRTK